MERETLILYAETNKTVDLLKAELKAKREAFDKENEVLLNDITEQSTVIDELRGLITEQAMKEFWNTGQKKMLGGIGVRVSEELAYDEAEAFTWAKEHGLCLTLDRKAFDKIAKIQDIPFVMKSEKITITIPKELKLEE